MLLSQICAVPVRSLANAIWDPTGDQAGLYSLREVAIKQLLFNVVGGSITFGLASLIDVLWPLWDEENRALHDLLIDTRTILD